MTLNESTVQVRERVGEEREEAASTLASSEFGGVIETVNSWSLPLPRSEFVVLETTAAAL